MPVLVCDVLLTACRTGRSLLGGGRLGLLSVVEEEIALEQELAQDLPEVTGFTTIITGCLATLQRESDGERYVV